MTMNTYQTIVGVFDEPAMASRTVELLQGAGFGAAQITYLDPSQRHATGFLAGLKRLFTGSGPETDAGEVTDDLTHMGISKDEADYYSDQYSAGHAIIAVLPDSHEQEQDALEILRSNGAHNYAMRSTPAQPGTSIPPTDYSQMNQDMQSTGYTQPGTSTPPTDYSQMNQGTQSTGYTQPGTSTQPTDYNQTNDYTDTSERAR